MPAELPPRPSMLYLQHLAKELLRAAKGGDVAAIARIGSAGMPRLADVHHALAREHGFATWADLRSEVERRSGGLRRRRGHGDHLDPTTFGPASFVAAAREAGWQPGRLPAAIVFILQGGVAEWLAAQCGFEEDPSLAPGNGRFFVSTDRKDDVGVSCLSPGATAMVTQVENQLALGGASRYVLLNLAGGIGPDVTAGEVAIVEAAVRDDGISDHYLPPGDTVDADVDLTGAVERALAAAGLAARRRTSWTTPAIYRQTLAQLDHYTRAGVSIVESEVASLFAVTRALGAAAAAVVVTTGVNVSGEQTMAADLAAIGRTQREAFRAILDALTPKA